ncbi:hypothetical protein [Pandoraea pulmonicola]|uniref:Uncharacterized protein n=1 Tax=Pandoraea pulmonicola TaxID=93221 RepID=A0AAJ4ZGP4_PANPU|nr:hypothetical protein [Pandoraea pulmonicola]SUA93027.1 Uncharacterised protein [Pandoraea pulmonicola]
MKPGLNVFSITDPLAHTHRNASTAQADVGTADRAMLDEAMMALSTQPPRAPDASNASNISEASTGSFPMRASDGRLPVLTHARISALLQHFVMASSRTSIFALARMSEALDAGSNNKTLTLEHQAASVGTGVLCVNAALDFLAATGAFLNRSKSAKEIKDAQWMPTLARLSPTLRPLADHFKTLQNGVANVALFGAVGSAGALWATRESLREESRLPGPTATPAPGTGTPSTSNELEGVQLAAAAAGTALRAIMPPLVSTCINLDEAKQKRHQYDLREGPEGSNVADNDGPVELKQFTTTEVLPGRADWA